MSTPVTMNEPVLVRAKHLRKEAICIEFEVIDKPFGDSETERDIRKLSRTYTFDESGEARMPLRMAKILLSEHPTDFEIIGSFNNDEKVQEEVKKIQKKADRAEGKAEISCEYCEAKLKTKAGLSSHIRYNHPEQFKKLYKKE